MLIGTPASWAPPARTRARQPADQGHCGDLARLLGAAFGAECRRFESSPGSPSGRLAVGIDAAHEAAVRHTNPRSEGRPWHGVPARRPGVPPGAPPITGAVTGGGCCRDVLGLATSGRGRRGLGSGAVGRLGVGVAVDGGGERAGGVEDRVEDVDPEVEAVRARDLRPGGATALPKVRGPVELGDERARVAPRHALGAVEDVRAVVGVARVGGADGADRRALGVPGDLDRRLTVRLPAAPEATSAALSDLGSS